MHPMSNGRVWSVRRQQYHTYVDVWSGKRFPTIWYYPLIPITLTGWLLVPGWVEAFWWAWGTLTVLAIGCGSMYIVGAEDGDIPNPYSLKWFRGRKEHLVIDGLPRFVGDYYSCPECVPIITYYLENRGRLSHYELQHLKEQASKAYSLAADRDREMERLEKMHNTLPDFTAGLEAEVAGLKEMQ